MKTKKVSEKDKTYLITITGSLLVSAVLIITYIFIPVGQLESNKLTKSGGNAFFALGEQFDYINDILFRENGESVAEVKTVATKYSILYKNNLSRKMYVFSVPVRELSGGAYTLFDNKIYDGGSGVFLTKNSNFNLTFTGEKINFKNSAYDFSLLTGTSPVVEKIEESMDLYGDVREGVFYNGIKDCMNASFYPSYNGLYVELEIMEADTSEKPDLIEFELEHNNKKGSFDNDNAGYVRILQDKEAAGIVYQGIIIDSENNISHNNKIRIRRRNKKDYLQIDPGNFPEGLVYPIKFYFNIDFYYEKMFYDTSVYEASAKTNNLMNNISVFNTQDEKSNGYTYIKFNTRSLTPKDSSLLDSVTFNFFVMYMIGYPELEIYKVNKSWCSWLITWNAKPAYNDKICEITLTETGWNRVDLTEYVKRLIDNKYDKLEDNSIMIKIKNGSKSYVLTASADNTVMPPYFEVNYRTG